MRLVLVALIVAAMAGPAASGETIQQYAANCDKAVGVTVPAFNCNDGTEVPVTNAAHDPSTQTGVKSCDRPNRLNGECDPGSRFQVLHRDNKVQIVAHCRKRGLKDDNLYSDIAVIQYNEENGSACFYQALETDETKLGDELSAEVIAPSDTPKPGAKFEWKPPAEMAAIGCGRCHDTGAIFRSPYMVQDMGAKDTLPHAGEFGYNQTNPYNFVGEDTADWELYAVEVQDNACNNCHRIGASNILHRGVDNPEDGTALHFGLLATQEKLEASKNPHSEASPIWMPPTGNGLFDADNHKAARALKACAEQIKPDKPLPDTDACRATKYNGPAVLDDTTVISGPLMIAAPLGRPISIAPMAGDGSPPATVTNLRSADFESGNLAVVKTGDALLALLAQKPDGRMWRKAFDPASPADTAWTGLGTRKFPPRTKMATVDFGAKGLAFATTRSRTLAASDGTSAWQENKALALSLGSTPAAIVQSRGVARVVALGNDNRLHSVAYDSRRRDGRWSAWDTLGRRRFPQGYGIALTSPEAGVIQVFAQGFDHRIVTATYDKRNPLSPERGRWSEWNQLGDRTFAPGTSIAVARPPAAAARIFAVALDGAVWSANADGTSAWTEIPGEKLAVGTRLTVAPQGDQGFAIYAKSSPFSALRGIIRTYHNPAAADPQAREGWSQWVTVVE